jgi:hypothetical protein
LTLPFNHDIKIHLLIIWKGKKNEENFSDSDYVFNFNNLLRKVSTTKLEMKKVLDFHYSLMCDILKATLCHRVSQVRKDSEVGRGHRSFSCFADPVGKVS